jgi:hypothetical protein
LWVWIYPQKVLLYNCESTILSLAATSYTPRIFRSTYPYSSMTNRSWDQAPTSQNHSVERHVRVWVALLVGRTRHQASFQISLFRRHFRPSLRKSSSCLLFGCRRRVCHRGRWGFRKLPTSNH